MSLIPESLINGDPDSGKHRFVQKGQLPVIDVRNKFYQTGREAQTAQMKRFSGGLKTYNPPESGVFDLINTAGEVPFWALSFSERGIYELPVGASIDFDARGLTEKEVLGDRFDHPFAVEREWTVFEEGFYLTRVTTVVRHHSYTGQDGETYEVFTQKKGESTQKLGTIEIADLTAAMAAVETLTDLIA